MLATSSNVMMTVKLTWQTVNVPHEKAEINPRKLTTIMQLIINVMTVVVTAGF